MGADEVAAALKNWYPLHQIRVGRYRGDPNGYLDMNSRRNPSHGWRVIVDAARECVASVTLTLGRRWW